MGTITNYLEGYLNGLLDSKIANNLKFVIHYDNKKYDFTFGKEYMSGCYYLSSGGMVIFCTPFHEDSKGVPIEFSRHDGLDSHYHLYEYDVPTNQREVKEFVDYYLTKIIPSILKYSPKGFVDSE